MSASAPRAAAYSKTKPSNQRSPPPCFRTSPRALGSGRAKKQTRLLWEVLTCVYFTREERGRARSPRRCHQRRHSEPHWATTGFGSGQGLASGDRMRDSGELAKGTGFIWAPHGARRGCPPGQRGVADPHPHPHRLPAASSRSRRAPKRHARGQARTPALHTLRLTPRHTRAQPPPPRIAQAHPRRRAHVSVRYLRCVRAPQPEGNRRNDYSSGRSRLPSPPPASRVRGDTRRTQSTPGVPSPPPAPRPSLCWLQSLSYRRVRAPWSPGEQSCPWLGASPGGPSQPRPPSVLSLSVSLAPCRPSRAAGPGTRELRAPLGDRGTTHSSQAICGRVQESPGPSAWGKGWGGGCLKVGIWAEATSRDMECWDPGVPSEEGKTGGG